MNTFKRGIQSLLKKTGYEISAIQHETFEKTIPEYMAQVHLSGRENITIFDAGAHHGQTSLLYNRLFSNPEIYSFEPFKESFECLQKQIAGHPNIRAFNYALDRFSGTVKLHVNQSSQTNSILATDRLADQTWGADLLITASVQEIDSISIDDFIAEQAIEKIDILKLDTQGSESNIILGASKTISENRVGLIYLEIITMPTYEGQKNFDEVLLLLRQNDFELYDLYNYSHTTSGQLRQVDGIFIHRSFSRKDIPHIEGES